MESGLAELQARRAEIDAEIERLEKLEELGVCNKIDIWISDTNGACYPLFSFDTKHAIDKMQVLIRELLEEKEYETVA